MQIYSHARCELPQTIQAFVVVSLVIRVTSVERYYDFLCLLILHKRFGLHVWFRLLFPLRLKLTCLTERQDSLKIVNILGVDWILCTVCRITMKLPVLITAAVPLECH